MSLKNSESMGSYKLHLFLPLFLCAGADCVSAICAWMPGSVASKCSTLALTFHASTVTSALVTASGSPCSICCSLPVSLVQHNVVHMLGSEPLHLLPLLNLHLFEPAPVLLESVHAPILPVPVPPATAPTPAPVLHSVFFKKIQVYIPTELYMGCAGQVIY